MTTARKDPEALDDDDEDDQVATGPVPWFGAPGFRVLGSWAGIKKQKPQAHLFGRVWNSYTCLGRGAFKVWISRVVLIAVFATVIAFETSHCQGTHTRRDWRGPHVIYKLSKAISLCRL